MNHWEVNRRLAGCSYSFLAQFHNNKNLHLLVCAHPLKLGETLLHSDDVMFVFEDKVILKLQTKYTNKIFLT